MFDMQPDAPTLNSAQDTISLGSGYVGLKGEVVGIDASRCPSPTSDLERILLEMGFVEGTRVEVIHEGPFGGNPLAVRVANMRVALRRHEAHAILISTAHRDA